MDAQCSVLARATFQRSRNLQSMPEKPVARLEEAVVQIRKLCAGEEVKKSGMKFFDYDGAKLTGVTLPGKKGSTDLYRRTGTQGS